MHPVYTKAVFTLQAVTDCIHPHDPFLLEAT
jgi:hypothetical protein